MFETCRLAVLAGSLTLIAMGCQKSESLLGLNDPAVQVQETETAEQLSATIPTAETQVDVQEQERNPADSDRGVSSKLDEVKQLIATMDEDGDGMISQTEAAAELKPYFSAVDANGDGLIDSAEAKVIVEYSRKATPADPPQEEVVAKDSLTVQQLLDSMDKDGDGNIARDEASEELILYFDEFDKNSDRLIDGKEAESVARAADGQIDELENPSQKLERAKQIIAEVDQNGDGKVSRDEAPAEVVSNFAQFDTNQDGFIDANEALVFLGYIEPDHADPSKQAPASTVTAKNLIRFMDKDGDGKISHDEANEQLKPHFQNIDTNGDGLIDEQEAETLAKYANQSQNK